jgi:hypothetical protein
MIEAGITAIDINSSIREIPQTGLLGAVDCLVKAEMMHKLEKSLLSPAERQEQASASKYKVCE